MGPELGRTGPDRHMTDSCLMECFTFLVVAVAWPKMNAFGLTLRVSSQNFQVDQGHMAKLRPSAC